MPGTPVNVGTATTVMFLRSGFTAQVTSLAPYDLTVKTMPTGHMAQAQPLGTQQGGHPYASSKFGDMGDLQISGYYNPQTRLPESGVFETVIITPPLVAADTTHPYWIGTACLTQFQPDGPYDGLMEFSARWKWSGQPELRFEGLDVAEDGGGGGEETAPVAHDYSLEVVPPDVPSLFSLLGSVDEGTSALAWETLVVVPEEFLGDADELVALLFHSTMLEEFPDLWYYTFEPVAWDGTPLTATYHVADVNGLVSNTAFIFITAPSLAELIADDKYVNGRADGGDGTTFSLVSSVHAPDGDSVDWTTLSIAPLDFDPNGTLTILTGGDVYFMPGPSWEGSPSLVADYSVHSTLGLISNTALITVYAL